MPHTMEKAIAADGTAFIVVPDTFGYAVKRVPKDSPDVDPVTVARCDTRAQAGLKAIEEMTERNRWLEEVGVGI